MKTSQTSVSKLNPNLNQRNNCHNKEVAIGNINTNTNKNVVLTCNPRLIEINNGLRENTWKPYPCNMSSTNENNKDVSS